MGEHTQLIKGVLIDKDMSHPQMPKEIKNAKLAILTCPFEPPKPKTNHKLEIQSTKHFEMLKKIEKDYFIDMIKLCQEAGANVIICQWGFDDEANYLLMQAGLTALRWIGGIDIELIAVSTGACIVPRLSELTPQKLGKAKIMRETYFANRTEKVIFIQG